MAALGQPRGLPLRCFGASRPMTTIPNAAMTTLGVYVQVPFCASKCSFCNFSSGVERSTVFGQYTRMLQRELESWPDSFAARGISPEILALPVDSIYMGGGTPALLGAESLERVVRGLNDRLRWGGELEFTLETTPGSADLTLLGALRGMGVNRLSIGAQTFDDRELRAVGRLHSADDTCELVREARQAGFQNISLDLIAGLPHQTEASFRGSLEAVAALRPEHVSLYLFEVDEKAGWGRRWFTAGAVTRPPRCRAMNSWPTPMNPPAPSSRVRATHNMRFPTSPCRVLHRVTIRSIGSLRLTWAWARGRIRLTERGGGPIK